MDLKDLKILWKEQCFRPEKRLGQNFLIDKNVRDNILSSLSLTGEEVVIEIGPGFGAMTFELAKRCKKVIAIEKDRRVCKIMQPLFEEAGNITLLNEDILEFDFNSLKEKGPFIVYGNVPYYISTPIIEKMITERENVTSLSIVIQEELADRIVSPPGSRVYGSVSCYIQYYTRVVKVLRIKKTCFCPVPKVDSCLLKLEMLKTPSVEVKDEKLLFRIIRASFSQRRKKLVNPLSSSGVKNLDKNSWINILTDCGIDPSARAEALSLEDYAKLANNAGNM